MLKVCFLKIITLLGFLIGLSAQPGWAATYYVRTMAGAGHTCGQAVTDNDANAMNTITTGLPCLAAGDTLRIHTEVYNESFYCGITTCFPSGSRDTTRMTIAAFATSPSVYESVTIRSLNSQAMGLRVLNFQFQQYITLEGLIIDGVNMDNHVIQVENTAHHLRFLNVEVMNSKNISCFNVDGANNEVLNSKIHSCR